MKTESFTKTWCLDDDTQPPSTCRWTARVGLGTKTVVLFAGADRLDSASVEITAVGPEPFLPAPQ